MPLYHGFIDLKRIAVSEKLSPSAKNQFSGPPWRHSLSDTGKQMYRGDVNGEF